MGDLLGNRLCHLLGNLFGDLLGNLFGDLLGKLDYYLGDLMNGLDLNKQQALGSK